MKPVISRSAAQYVMRIIYNIVNHSESLNFIIQLPTVISEATISSYKGSYKTRGHQPITFKSTVTVVRYFPLTIKSTTFVAFKVSECCEVWDGFSTHLQQNNQASNQNKTKKFILKIYFSKDLFSLSTNPSDWERTVWL